LQAPAIHPGRHNVEVMQDRRREVDDMHRTDAAYVGCESYALDQQDR
jgi:hypothetical protein